MKNKWCINKHGASKIIDTFETYQCLKALTEEIMITKKWMWTLPSYYGDEMDLGMKE
jgi:hypothetical protein